MAFTAENPLSLILTGAPTTGKSTIAAHLMSARTHRLALDYTTRTPRNHEVDGVDRHFVNKPLFVEMHERGMFYEPSLDFAEYNGNYYGTPRSWAADVDESDSPQIMVVVSTAIAGLIKRDVQNKALWVHLTADSETRAQRLKNRGHSEEEIAYRLNLNTGDSQTIPDGIDLALNTSTMNERIAINILLLALCQKNS